MTPSPDPQIRAVLSYWFGDPDPAADLQPRMQQWFGGGPEVDDEIRGRFGDLVRRARSGQLDGWRTSTAGTLALVILLDQFSRNVHRGDGASWACDPACQRIALTALALGVDAEVGVMQRSFLYLPLEHAEDRLLQQVSVRCFSRLVVGAPAHHRATVEMWLDYALKHKSVVDRFGRFPHRNAPIGRQSTDEERAFVEEHGAGF